MQYKITQLHIALTLDLHFRDKHALENNKTLVVNSRVNRPEIGTKIQLLISHSLLIVPSYNALRR